MVFHFETDIWGNSKMTYNVTVILVFSSSNNVA